MRILGLSFNYHDAAACLLVDGEIVAAAEEERFSRRKHDSGYPRQAAAWCLEHAGVVPEQLDYVVFYEKPILKFERILSGYAATYPRSRYAFEQGVRTWLADKLWVRDEIRRALKYSGPVLFGEHHMSHAASAYYPSPFPDAAVITADGVGEWATTTVGVGRGIDLSLSHEIRYPHSLGLLYSAFTAYLGFEVNEGEYKVMGMAAYGTPKHVDKVRKVIDLAADGSFRLDMRYFEYHRKLRAFGRAFEEMFGPARQPDGPVDDRHADIAASIQAVLEEAVLGLARRARELSGSPRLCLAGGIALNVIANSRVLREAGFDDVWIQPAAGDSGGCIGAATHLYHAILREERRVPMSTAYLGPSYTDEEIASFLRSEDVPFRTLAPDEIAPTTARLLADGQVVAWFQGRMEFGPRALGSRSILASPLDGAMKDKLNEKIKHREQFRPFAPSVLAEASARFFDFDGRTDRESPFMLLLARVRDEAKGLIPAVVHADGTARAQTVRREDNPLYYAVIEEFGHLTGVPVVVNTSFNVRGEPIVCTPAQAFNSFSHTDMDHLVMGNALVPASSKKQIGPYPGARFVRTSEVVV